LLFGVVFVLRGGVAGRRTGPLRRVAEDAKRLKIGRRPPPLSADLIS
jgi:hypothetical protein